MSYREVAVQNLRPGDWVDLEGDPYGDPNNDPWKAMLFVEVVSVKQETADCVAVTFNFDVVGFPTDHTLPMKEH